MVVENSLDELWIGVKGQSNSVIAGSPRNIFRYSLMNSVTEVEHWMGKGPYQVTNPNQTSNAVNCYHGSQTAGDKIRSREGNSPDHQLRSQIMS